MKGSIKKLPPGTGPKEKQLLNARSNHFPMTVNFSQDT